MQNLCAINVSQLCGLEGVSRYAAISVSCSADSKETSLLLILVVCPDMVRCGASGPRVGSGSRIGAEGVVANDLCNLEG